MKKKKGTALGDVQKEAALGGICDKCKVSFPVLTVEHIIPVTVLEAMGIRWEGGYDDLENFEKWCRRCNALKNYRLDFNNPKTFVLLRKYVDLAEQLYGLKTQN